MRKVLILLCIVSTFQLSAQRVADLGIRFNTSEYNRIQVEFRKPFGENAFARLGLSMGFQYNYPGRSIFAANDSLVVTRQKDIYGNHYDFRLGLERKISYDWLSFHSDLIFAYSSISNYNWSYYHVPDSTGDWIFEHTNPYTGVQQDSAKTINTVLGGGLALGISFNFLVSDNFIINFSGNYTGMLRFAAGQKEINDVYDEFSPGNGTVFDLYPSAGIGLRFVFAPVEPDEPAIID